MSLSYISTGQRQINLSEDHIVDFWKGAKYGKQGTRQEQGKEKEKAGEAQAAEEVADGFRRLKEVNNSICIPQITFVDLRDVS